MSKNWRPRAALPDPALALELAERLCVSEILAGLLMTRGLTTAEDMDAYLSPGLRRLMRPEDIPGLTEAAGVIASAVAEGRRLAVWGDYDVDGVTAAALLLSFFRARGLDPLWRIPDRQGEGYGLSLSGIESLAAAGAELLVTVDCGIGGIAEVARARELGLGVVVTDHHLPGPELPEARAVCNPKLDQGPGHDLAGVGVAFFLAAALNRMLPGDPSDIRQYLDLVALGSLADVVELSGQNRILVKNGLLLLSEGRRPGLAALKEVAGMAPEAPLTASQAVFGLAPRINAAGRMGRADAALSLMLARDLDEARPLAALLDEENSRRREAEEAIRTEALAQAAERPDVPAHVLYAPGWHAGVIGIVASRVVEASYRPTLILTSEGDLLKGSGRSIPECDLHAALEAVSDLLSGFGGHRLAAGLSLAPDRLALLRERFAAAVAEQIGPTPLKPTLTLDAALPFSAIDSRLVRELELMQPFGQGNPEPLFASPLVTVTARRIFGERHVLLTLRDPESGFRFKGKAWRMAESLPETLVGRELSLAFTPKMNYFNGLPEIELNVRDVRSDLFLP